MSKFNQRVPIRPTGPIVTARTPTGTTYQGGAGYERDAKSELFLLAVTNMVGEDTFYENAKNRDDRYSKLIAQNAVADPEWTVRFLKWLRTKANMRSASLVGAAEFVKARLDAGLFDHVTEPGQRGWNRLAPYFVMQRADEPGEMLAYWTQKYGKKFPKPLKRAVADAVADRYTEFNLLKWDSDRSSYRFGDVIDLVHPTAKDDRQGLLFEHALDRRHGRDNEIHPTLTVIRNRDMLMSLPVGERRQRILDDPAVLQRAGMTWESLAGWLQGPMDAQMWELMIPHMGYMALLRNLRNFEQAGISKESVDFVLKKLADPDEVAKSRQLPMRFLSAFQATNNLKWWPALEEALNHSLSNVPELDGHTLVLIDTSGSMDSSLSKNSDLMRMDAAIMFGLAMAQRSKESTVVSFSNRAMHYPMTKGASLLTEYKRFGSQHFRQRGGTYTHRAIQDSLKPEHTRVLIVTDEQSYDNWRGYIPDKVPVYTWNLAGYRMGTLPGGGNRHVFGGLSDQAFQMIPLLEAGRSQNWPF